ncbi:HD-GYP domain-containing protein [Oceanibaculum indicum]|uniref:Putative two-component system response regulator n=1 Tax=Oceanibaculum indicum TaxID=526216 RepID=A0A420WQK1_9PROT|nr:HD domain-containing phosphohydrolase [Oceanibaculum indicum]RKQ73327.1 putative two-component system response regulator [Oceanibaculum indicum]
MSIGDRAALARLEADTSLDGEARCRLQAHQHAVGGVASLIARRLGLGRPLSAAIGRAAAYHDVGKLRMPSEILCKPGRLTAEEYAVIRRHTLFGHDILALQSGRLAPLAARIALHHHEAMDGSGYPNGLKGRDIPVEARIVGVADVYDALREDRPYRAGMSHDQAMAVLLDGDDRTWPAKFCPKVLRTAEDCHEEIARSWRLCNA